MRQDLLISFIWIHIRYKYNASTSTDLELLQIAKDAISARRFIVSHESEIEPTVEPHLTFKVRGPFQDSTDEQIKAGDLVDSWIQDLEEGKGLTFDREYLFMDPELENVNRVVVGWDDSDLANSLSSPLVQWFG